MTEPASRQAVEVAERYADGAAPAEALARAFEAACAVSAALTNRFNELVYGPDPAAGDTADVARMAAGAAVDAAAPNYLEQGDVEEPDAWLAWGFAGRVMNSAALHRAILVALELPDYGQHPDVEGVLKRSREEVNIHLAELFRCIVGNPFRPVTLDPAWRTLTTAQLATAIYDDRAFERLPILADALEEAGCMDADILGHLRGPRPHVRGCWVVDALLGWE